MSKKSLLAVALLFAFAASSFATEIVSIGLNYYCRGQLRLVTDKLPPGVTVSGRRNYSQKRWAKICYYSILVDIAQTQEIELEFEVVDTEGKPKVKLDPSISPPTGKSVECVEFEVAGKPSALVPRTLSKWTSMIKGFVFVSKGQRFTVKAKFGRPEE